MSKKDLEEISKEQQRANMVIQEISKKINKLEMNKKDVGGDAGHLRETFWEDVTVNFDEPDDVLETHISLRQQAELLGERERNIGLIHKQLKTLEKLKYSPYFGRIDFKEEQEDAEAIYIGITSFMDQNDENFYIYDWRAPISSVYYDYSPGDASYKTPEGKIDGELLLKRQFLIREGKILNLFDTGVTIGDELLLEVLGTNASSMMKSIVATIQKEQNKIIRNETSKYLIVQGVAGSGKTSAALQRVAFLLYRHRDTLKSDNIMLFSPNPLFNSYVSTVLPELGEENMQQTTWHEYILNRVGKSFDVEDPFAQLEALLSDEDEQSSKLRLAAIQYKSSLAFKEHLDEFMEGLSKNGIVFKNITFRKKVLISKEELARKFYELDDHITIPNRMQSLKDWAQSEMRKHAKAERKQSWVEEEMMLLDKEDYLSAFKAAQKNNGDDDEFAYFDKEEVVLRKVIVNKRFKSIYKGIKNLRFIDYGQIYKNAFDKRPDELSGDKWTSLVNSTIVNLEQRILWNEDATAFAYLKDMLEGKKASTGIRQVFIDEAQDYSAFQISYIKKLFPYSKMTFLGDLNQAIFAHGNDEFLRDGSDEDVEKITLTKSYRSTSEIIEFTRSMAHNGDEIEPFNRHGNKPLVIEVPNEKTILAHIEEDLQHLKESGNKTIAIICKTQKESIEVYESLKGSGGVRLLEKGTISYEKGISVVPAYLAKGIEFDAVILYNSSVYVNEMEKELFYTACTRAMHELYVYKQENIPNPFLDNIDKEAFRLKKISN
ncbi:helicase [Niallia circulans]|uniref:Helicase n=1 Tax=Niallia circulans TaxID=1397 RepID=A0A553SN01_NIACI|nr:RNA polymerase recycling motor HelD [Niallia circulans]TRZ38373.1 helicase [Niallia circulans]